MKIRTLRAGVAAIGAAVVALAAGAQGPPPPPPGGFGDPGPGALAAGMFEFGGLVGAFGGRVVTGKPFQATFTITRTQTLPSNSIRNTTTGTIARDADGSTYRDVIFPAIGPWASSGKPRNFAYIRNQSKMTEYFVNISKATYEAFPLRQHDNFPRPPRSGRGNGAGTSNETVTDNPNASYMDPVTHTVYKVDAKKITRTIPAGEIGNEQDIVITTERWYSSDLDLVLEETHSDPRFGTSDYQLSNIGQPQASLFLPDSSFTQVQGKGFGPRGFRGEGKLPPPPAVE